MKWELLKIMFLSIKDEIEYLIFWNFLSRYTKKKRINSI